MIVVAVILVLLVAVAVALFALRRAIVVVEEGLLWRNAGVIFF